jgi:hypothetical protein
MRAAAESVRAAAVATGTVRWVVVGGARIEQLFQDLQPHFCGDVEQLVPSWAPGHKLAGGGEWLLAIDDKCPWAELAWPEDEMFFLIVLFGWEGRGCCARHQHSVVFVDVLSIVSRQDVGGDVEDEVRNGLWQATRSLQLVD